MVGWHFCGLVRCPLWVLAPPGPQHSPFHFAWFLMRRGLERNQAGGALWNPWLCAMDTGWQPEPQSPSTGLSLPHLAQRFLGLQWVFSCPQVKGTGSAGQGRPGQVCTWTRGLGVVTGSKPREGGGKRLGRQGGPHHPCFTQALGGRGPLFPVRDRGDDIVEGKLIQGQGPALLGTEPTWLTLLLGIPLWQHLQP